MVGGTFELDTTILCCLELSRGKSEELRKPLRVGVGGLVEQLDNLEIEKERESEVSSRSFCTEESAPFIQPPHHTPYHLPMGDGRRQTYQQQYQGFVAGRNTDSHLENTE